MMVEEEQSLLMLIFKKMAYVDNWLRLGWIAGTPDLKFDVKGSWQFIDLCSDNVFC